VDQNRYWLTEMLTDSIAEMEETEWPPGMALRIAFEILYDA
jgi:hypothetical protein